MLKNYKNALLILGLMGAQHVFAASLPVVSDLSDDESVEPAAKRSRSESYPLVLPDQNAFEPEWGMNASIFLGSPKDLNDYKPRVDTVPASFDGYLVNHFVILGRYVVGKPDLNPYTDENKLVLAKDYHPEEENETVSFEKYSEVEMPILK